MEPQTLKQSIKWQWDSNPGFHQISQIQTNNMCSSEASSSYPQLINDDNHFENVWQRCVDHSMWVWSLNHWSRTSRVADPSTQQDLIRFPKSGLTCAVLIGYLSLHLLVHSLGMMSTTLKKFDKDMWCVDHSMWVSWSIDHWSRTPSVAIPLMLDSIRFPKSGLSCAMVTV